jgi:hypothetical protein
MPTIRDIKSRYKSTAFFLYMCVYIKKKCVKIDTLLVFVVNMIVVTCICAFFFVSLQSILCNLE